MNIGRFSVRNPVFLNILMVSLLALGALSLSRMPREQFSEVPFYWAVVTVPFPGASAEDVESLLTTAIENELQGIDRMDALRSVSEEGFCTVRVEFESNLDTDEFERLFQEVRTRFYNVTLPDGAGEGRVSDFSSADFLPAGEIVLFGDASYGSLVREAELLRDDVLRLPDVSSVDVQGVRNREIFVELDAVRMEAAGLSVNEVVRALEGVNVNVPGGTITSESNQFLLRTTGAFAGPDDILSVPLRAGNGGGQIRIADIASLRDGYSPRGGRVRFNGRPAVLLSLLKEPGGDAVSIIESSRTLLSERTFPDDVRAELINDSTVQIRDSIRVLQNNALFGFLLLVVMLFLFLGGRNAFVTALGLPVTFATTFLILDLLGETFNSNTLFALVLSLGMIVDHGIVIVENSFRLKQTGLSRIDSAEKGVHQVAVPVMAATATTVAAFIPLMLLPGTIGRFLRVIPFTVSIALLVSTLEALFFLPSHYAEWGGGKGFGSFFASLRPPFLRLFEGIYRRKKRAVLLMVLFAFGAFSLVPGLRQDLFSAEDFTLFYIEAQMPTGTPPDRTEAFLRAYEQRILPLLGQGDVVGVSSFVGFQSQDGDARTQGNRGQIVVDLSERSEGRLRSIPVIMDEIKKMTEDIPGADRVLFRRATNGPPVSPPVSFRIFGDSLDDLQQASDQLKQDLAVYPELFNIQDDAPSGTPELRVVVDREQAAVYGMDVLQIGSFLRASLDGMNAGTFRQDNEEVDLIVGFSAGARIRSGALSQLKLISPAGEAVPLSSLTRLEWGDAPASIQRLDGKREITVSAEAYDTENVRAINREIQRGFDKKWSGRNLRLSAGGEFSELDDLLIRIARIFLLGLFLIYMILGSQFRSYSQPFLILLTLPFTFAGVVLFLFLSGTAFSTTVLYAAVALAGIAVNDSIVLISFINERKEAGESVKDAVSQAVAVRVRPVLLTSLTTIAGLLPTALGLGGKSVIWGPMAGTVIFGLIFSTLTALFLIPCFYGIFFDRRKKE